MNLVKLRRGIIKKILCVTNPVKLARLIGVNFVENGLHIYGKIDWGTEPWIITLGNNVHITEGVKFITHDGGTLLFRSKIPDLEITKPICVGNDVYIGNNAMIMPGVIIGSKVVIGAGAIVSKDIPDNSVAVGVPAKVIKTADDYCNKLEQESLHLGNLKGQEKDQALMKYYKYNGKSKGIYF